MSEQHTPGPWFVYDGQWGDHSDAEGGGFQIIMGPYDGGVIRHIHLVNYADGEYLGDSGYEEAKANARLMAAAPELLAVLKVLLEPQHDPSTEGIARAIIAKVEPEPKFDMDRFMRDDSGLPA